MIHVTLCYKWYICLLYKGQIAKERRCIKFKYTLIVYYGYCSIDFYSNAQMKYINIFKYSNIKMDKWTKFHFYDSKLSAFFKFKYCYCEWNLWQISCHRALYVVSTYYLIDFEYVVAWVSVEEKGNRLGCEKRLLLWMWYMCFVLMFLCVSDES